MTKKQTEKRYIVTFLDPETDQRSAAAILDISSDTVRDGVSLMATDAIIEPSDVLYFEGLGSTSLSLSEAEANRLRNDKRVMAVEEDIEMHILNDDTENWEENPFETASQKKKCI